MDQQLNLDRTSFERFLATASLLQQLQKRAISLNSRAEDMAPQLAELVNTQQAIQAGALSVDEALLRITALAVRLVPAQGAGVWLYSGDALAYRAGAGTASSDESLRDVILSRLASGNLSADIHQDDNEARRLPLLRSLLLGPIHQGQKIAGVLAVFSENTECFGDRDQASTRLLSGLAAHALDKAANARFKQTVTLEREAVLHVIEALVPSLKELAETKPYPARQPVCDVDPAVRKTDSARVSGAENFSSIADPEPPAQGESREIRDLLSVLRNHETAASIEGNVESKFIEQNTFGSSILCPPRLDAPIAMSSLEVRTQSPLVAPIREVKSTLLHEAVRLPAIELDESAVFAAEMLARAKHLREYILALHVRTSTASWLRSWKPSFARMVSLPAASLHDLAAYVSERELFGRQRSKTIKRLGAGVALIIVAAIVTTTVVSVRRHRNSQTAPLAALRVNNVETVKPLVVGGSHKRVTDDAASAALGDMSRFEIPGLLRQARYGDGSAAFLIGMAYETGRGVPQNCEKAARWVKEAAMGGEAAAEYNLSLRYRDGDGLLADSEQSEKWLRKAAAQKYPQALTKAVQTNQTLAASSQP